MKIILLTITATLFLSAVYAQTPADSVPAYQRIPGVPPFKLMLVPDSVAFTKEELKKKKATIIMVFSPDCDHCIHSTEDMLANFRLLKKAQVIMATSLAYQHIQKFYSDLNMANYPSVKVGLDNTFFLGTFYEVHSYPAIFVYDKHGKFRRYFDGSAKWEEIAKAL